MVSDFSSSIRKRVQSLPEGCVIEVQDSGIGIAPEDTDRIFLPFEQLEKRCIATACPRSDWI